MKNGRNFGKPKSTDGHSSDVRAAGMDFNPGPDAPGTAAPTLHRPAEAGRRQRGGEPMSAPPTSTAISLGGASSHRSWRSWQAGAPPTACRTAASHRRPRRFRCAAHEEMAQNRGGGPPVSVLQGRRRRAGSAGTRPATGNQPTVLPGQ